MSAKNLSKFLIMALIINGILFSMAQPLVFGATSNFQLGFVKGTETYQVISYDNASWAKDIGTKLNITDVLEGQSNVTGAKSKTTIRAWYTATNGTFELFNSLLVPFEVQLLLLKGAETFNYSRKYINGNYSNDFQMWWGYSSRWNFTSNETFRVQPTDRTGEIVVLKNPEDWRTLLDEYNHWYDNISTDIDPLTEFFNLTLTSLNGSAFLWKIINSGKFAIPTPINSYLTGLVEGLRLNDTKVQGNTLIIERKGIKENYTVEITFTEKGTFYSYIIKNDTGTVLYNMMLIGHSNETVIPIIIIAACVIAGIVILSIYSRKRYR